MRRLHWWAIPAILLAGVLWNQIAGALALQLIQDGMDRPLLVTAPAGDFARIFIVEQPGRIWVVRDGRRNPVPFLDLSDRVLYRQVEAGLLGLAFHPDFAANGRFYVRYVGGTDAAIQGVIAEFAGAGDPMTTDVADPGSEIIRMSYPQPSVIHHGGTIEFGPDGFLYASTGDGGPQNDPNNRAQDPFDLHGKILRFALLDDGSFGIPESNPFASGLAGHPAVWAYGLRNPYRFSFDSVTGDLWIGDVGQDAREEIDFQPAGDPGGTNYGWRIFEGMRCNPVTSTEEACEDARSAVTFPLHDYSHAEGRCVIGGQVYRGTAIPGLGGAYFYGDCTAHKIWSFRREGGAVVDFVFRNPELDPDGVNFDVHLTSLGRDAAGELYITTFEKVFKIIPGEGEGLSAGELLVREFLNADTNNDGRLSYGEARSAMASLTDAAFAALDLNHDGALSRAELYGISQESGCQWPHVPWHLNSVLGDTLLAALALGWMWTWRRTRA